MARAVVAHLDVDAVVGPQEVQRFELGDTIRARELPVGPAGENFTAQRLAFEVPTDDRHDTARALWSVADGGRRTKLGRAREDELEAGLHESCSAGTQLPCTATRSLKGIWSRAIGPLSSFAASTMNTSERFLSCRSTTKAR